MKNSFASLKAICFLMLMLCWGVGFGQSTTVAWVKTMGGQGSGANALATTIDLIGNVYTTGQFNGTVDFDPGFGISNLTSKGLEDIFITKFDASGNFIWAKQMGGHRNDISNSISVDFQGNIYTAGSFQDTADFDPGSQVFNLITITTSSVNNVFISKLDSSGNFVWAKQVQYFSGYAFSQANAITVDALQNVYTTGLFLGTVDFDPGVGSFNLSSGGTSNQDVFILKLNSSGDFVWAKHLHSSGQNNGISIAIDSSQNVFTTGSFQDTLDLDPGSGAYNVIAKGYTNVFISKLNAQGNFIWGKSFVGIGTGSGHSIILDRKGNVLSTGVFLDTADFDPGSGVYNLLGFKNKLNCFVSKLDSSGNFLWAKQFGDSTSDANGRSIATDVGGNVYTTGEFRRTVDFDPGTGIFNLSAGLDNNCFLSKLDPFGNFLWAEGFISDSSYLSGQSIRTDSLNNVYVAGQFYGKTDFDPGVGVYNLIPKGYKDAFVFKLGQTTLPLHLLTFTAKRANTTNLLNWTTAQEVNTDRFEIERSSNGREFRRIGAVKAGSTSYTFTDNNPLKAVNYYRLKMLDKDGQFTYSPIRQLTINNSQFTINIFPNPTHNKLQLQINTDQKTTLQLDIITQDGKIVLSSNIAAVEGSILRSINVAALQSGTFFLRVTSGEGEQNVVKFEKVQ